MAFLFLSVSLNVWFRCLVSQVFCHDYDSISPHYGISRRRGCGKYRFELVMRLVREVRRRERERTLLKSGCSRGIGVHKT